MVVKQFLKLFAYEYFNKNKFKILLFILITVIYYLIEVLGISYILDNLFTKSNNLIYLSLFVFISLIILTYIRSRLQNTIEEEISSKNRIKYLNKILDRYSESFKDIKIGNTINRILIVTLEFSLGLVILMKNILPQLLIMTISVIYLMKLNISIGSVILICFLNIIPITVFNIKKITSQMGNLENQYYNNIDKLNNKFNNLFNSYINNEVDNDKQNIFKIQDTLKETALDASFYGVLNTTMLIANISVFILAIIVFLFKKKKDVLHYSDKTLLSVLLLYFITTYISFSDSSTIFFNHLGVCCGSIDFLENLLKTDNQKLIKNGILKGKIKIDKVYFSYNKKNILSNLNLVIPAKQKIAILGRSGSGKSTLAKLILKLYKYQGEIYIDDINIKDINTIYLRSKIVYSNQNSNLLDDTVIKNMQFGNHCNEIEVIKLLKKYNLDKNFVGLKKGIYEECISGGNNLSLGMQKIIIIIRAILKSKNSIIVILDEPLSGLDKFTKINVIKLIINECKNKTLCIITHDKEIIPYMDKVVDLININS